MVKLCHVEQATKVDRVPCCITRFGTGMKAFTDMFANYKKRRMKLTYSGKRHSQTHKWSWNKCCSGLQEAFVIGGAGDGSNSKDRATKKGSPFPE
eukprot:9147531-Ditylum_brightwellii.AAC.1